MSKIEIIKNECPKSSCAEALALMQGSEMEKVMAFHMSFPQYCPTPLVKLSVLAEKFGIRGIYVKDESHRFMLNAFKVLGGSYAIARYIAKITEKDIAEMTYQRLTSKELREEIGQITFFTATDGNHGRGVAWAANKLGQKAVVYMPAGSSPTRLANIRAEGAQASIIDGNYDDAVRLAAAESAKTPKSVVVQDTAWEGYEEIPGWIMQGYGTMAAETKAQLAEYAAVPTHIFVQAGVGSLAGAVQGFFAAAGGNASPAVTVVEPLVADCLFQSAKARDYRTVSGAMQTIMAGLACGEPNTISWQILKNHAAFFASCPDWVSAKGMRILASPLRGDTAVVSGESGAVGLGLLACLATDDSLRDFKDMLGLNKDSVVLLFSTEGDTDPQKYHDIVWDGEYASFA